MSLVTISPCPVSFSAAAHARSSLPYAHHAVRFLKSTRNQVPSTGEPALEKVKAHKPHLKHFKQEERWFLFSKQTRRKQRAPSKPPKWRGSVCWLGWARDQAQPMSPRGDPPLVFHFTALRSPMDSLNIYLDIKEIFSVACVNLSIFLFGAQVPAEPAGDGGDKPGAGEGAAADPCWRCRDLGCMITSASPKPCLPCSKFLIYPTATLRFFWFSSLSMHFLLKSIP